MSFIKLDKELYRKNFYTIAEETVMEDNFGAIVSLSDAEGHHVTDLYLFENMEQAGLNARGYWYEYIHGDREQAIELLGVETLLSWTFGELAGPGSTKVRNLEEWLDLYLEDPSEHYDEGPYDVELIGENIVEKIGFRPTVAYSMG